MTKTHPAASRPLACIVLAAGKGTRMTSDRPKVLHRIANRSMVGHVLAAAAELGPGMDNVAAEVAPHPVAVQVDQRGTGDAVMAARPVLEDFWGDVLVLYGDTPLVTPATLRTMIAARSHADDPAVVVLGMRPDDPGAYGRLIVAPGGGLEAIVEYLDTSPEQCAVDLCNDGLMAFDGAWMWDLLDRIGNAKGEYYLTDAVSIDRGLGHACRVVEGSAVEVERLLQQRLRRAAWITAPAVPAAIIAAVKLTEPGPDQPSALLPKGANHEL
jgi:bifunctional UDP-N-acetylglucosamine pyrophosphorylase / glucosamine-1-phosphate N-acetyltransferase